MVKSLVAKLSSSASSTLSIAAAFGSSNNSSNISINNNKSQNGHIIGGIHQSTIVSNNDGHQSQRQQHQMQNKYRNDPGRFFGDGVQFKAKLIGILEVGEARGDRMCQEALQDLKMAIRAAGEHKQRITIHVTIDGLRLRDEKTGDSLYHHPVHKISFIAQDMTDTRAFGYIFGSPDSGHRFFGIKTDKAASQVVLAMRDLFQVVFELKKKEIELARQQIQSKSTIHHDQQQHQQQQQQQLSSLSSLKNVGNISNVTNDLSGGLGLGTGAGSLSLLNSSNLNIGVPNNTSNLSRDNKVTLKELSPESVADLVDLEQELNSLQRGITQMERITPNDMPQSLLSTAQKNYHITTTITTTTNDDPFGDSFAAYNLLPPPEPGRSRLKSNNKINETGGCASTMSNVIISSSTSITTSSPTSTVGLLMSQANAAQLHSQADHYSGQTQQQFNSTLIGGDGNTNEDDYTWLRELHSQSNVLETTKTPLSRMKSSGIMAPLAIDEVPSSLTPTQQLYENSVNAIGVSSDERLIKQMVNGDGLNATDRSSSSLTDIFQTTLGVLVNDNLNVSNAKSVVVGLDVFTDLDPLGTGRTRPYIDKKYFFQDLKNPPKKVLKDLSVTTVGPLSQNMEGPPSCKTSTATITITALTLQNEGKFSLNDSEIISSVYTTTTSANPIITTTITTTISNTILSSGILSIRAPCTQTTTTKSTTTSLYAGTINCVSSVATVSSAYVKANVKPTIINPNSSTFICTCPPPTTIASVSLTNISVNRFTNTVLGSTLTQGSQNSQSLQLLPKYPLSSFSINTTAHSTTTTITTFTMPLTQNNAMRFTRYPLEEVNINTKNSCSIGMTTTTAAIASNPVMFPRDTDPFSPTRKKSDPFEEGGDIFSKLDPFEFEFITSNDQINKSSNAGDGPINNAISSPANTALEATKAQGDVFVGPLQVKMPTENIEDGGSNVSHEINSSIRSRPMSSVMVPLPSASAASSVFRQQTVDVLSTISNKKMPHLFGQTSRFSKRDSNSINMRRLQESDSLSENEAAPEPPPRPVISSYAEPPPLPPKKQFNDIVIRPRSGLSQQLVSNGGSGTTCRYEFMNSKPSTNNILLPRNLVSGLSSDSPPIPLPCRRVGRSDATYPGPGRPRKPGHTEDDYLTPLSVYTDNKSAAVDVPPLLPPPSQVSSRTRSQRLQNIGKTNDIYENKTEIIQQQKCHHHQEQQQGEKVEPLVADITLSQLLTLSIDELATKLNVSTSKLSTMTLVELTSYLSEFIEDSKRRSESENIKTDGEMALPMETSANRNTSTTFKMNFDQQATFVAKFDDTFGENLTNSQINDISFEANFAQFDKIRPEDSQPMKDHQVPTVPSADRYAIFREIIDQELQSQETNLMGDSEAEGSQPNVENTLEFEAQINDDNLFTCNSGLNSTQTNMSITVPAKIDTKITEVVAQAKDRYAALRDIILVENLFDKPGSQKKKSILEESQEEPDQHNLTNYNGTLNEVDDDDFNNEDQDLQQLMNEGTMLASDKQQQRMGLVDSRGMMREPSSSALTVEDEDDDDEEEEEEEREVVADTLTEAGDKSNRHISIRSKKSDNISGGFSSGDSGDKNRYTLTPGKYEQLANSTHQLEQLEEKKSGKFQNTPTINITQVQNMTSNENSLLTVTNVNNMSRSKDDLEIDILMQTAISNLSLETRDHNSPANSTTQSLPPDISMDSAVRSQAAQVATSTQLFNDVSTSPISLSQSPLPIASKVSISTETSFSKVTQQQNVSSSIPTQLTVVSQLIDVATKQIREDSATKTTPDSWATFDTVQEYHPRTAMEKRSRPPTKATGKFSNFLHLPPPPAPASNTSQNDTAGESPCSSDTREEAWHRHNVVSGSNVSLGHQSSVLTGSRRWHKKESKHTSSSSRDLSWDDEQVGSQSRRLDNMMIGSHNIHTDRHNYHPRYSRRMNSCDEDYEYEGEFQSNRRDQRQIKAKISRSRDNFDLDSPSYYHYGGPIHHTWFSQDFEQVRSKAIERAAYERNLSYGPQPNYDKRGIPFPPLSQTSKSGTSDRRPNRGKFYRSEYTRTSNSDFDEFGDNLSTYRDEHVESFDKLKMPRRVEYENVFDDTRRTPPSLSGEGGVFSGSFKRSRPTDLYAYERDRKSFDRESLESFDSLSTSRRRRRSFGSSTIGGPESTVDPYITYDNREECHRYMTPEKSRSLRRLGKSSRTSGGGDIDYDRDSDDDHRASLSRPHLPVSTCPPASSGPSSGGMMVAYYYRKKQRTRNKSSQNNSGGRYRDFSCALPGVMRSNNYEYVTRGSNQNNDEDDDAEDYVDEEEDEAMEGDDDEMPTDEDKFERLNRRRHDMHQRIMESEQRRYHDRGSNISNKMNTAAISASNISPAQFGSYNRKGNKSRYVSNRQSQVCCNQDYGYDDNEYEQTPTPQSNASSAMQIPSNTSTKFNFDVGFESDFNQSSPPPASAATTFSGDNSTQALRPAATIPKTSNRFSNDFSDREKSKSQVISLHQQHKSKQEQQKERLDSIAKKSTPNTASNTSPGGVGVQKLRFDDNVKISQFDDESTAVAFEDDFSKANFSTYDNVDQWRHGEDNLIPKIQSSTINSVGNRKQQIRNSILQQRQQELLKKSESINIFAKKSEDPFEDDDFFKSPTAATTATTLTQTPTILLSLSAADVNTSTTTTTITTAGHINNDGGNNSTTCTGNDIGVDHSDISQKPQDGTFTPTTVSHHWDDNNSNFAKFGDNM